MQYDSLGETMRQKQTLCFREVYHFLEALFDDDLHAKRILSLANATLGVIKSASLAVNTIGQGLALARGLLTKHAIKQVDRLLSNEGIDVDAALSRWIPYVVGSRTSINVAMDWTDFDADGQATIMLSLLTQHGRATPLLWLTVDKSTLKNRRNEYEYQALVRLADALPADIKVCIVADRGFGDPLPGQHHGDRRGRRNAHRRRLCWTRRAGAPPARRHGDGRSLSGGNRVVRARQEDETGLVFGCQQHQRDFAGFDEPVWQALGHRMRAARHQGPAFRHGHGIDPRQHAGAARQAMAAERICNRTADLTRGGR